MSVPDAEILTARHFGATNKASAVSLLLMAVQNVTFLHAFYATLTEHADKRPLSKRAATSRQLQPSLFTPLYVSQNVFEVEMNTKHD